jgi:hypothetical protein
LCEHYSQAVGGTSSRRWHLIPRLERKFIHDAKDLLIRLEHACSVEILANFAENIATLGIERAHGESVRIGFGVSARDFLLLGGPQAKQLV